MVKHATLNAIFALWCGYDFAHPAAISWPERHLHDASVWHRACDSRGEDNCIPVATIPREIPTCPRCAVLYDEAMTAREELLGRKEAA